MLLLIVSIIVLMFGIVCLFLDRERLSAWMFLGAICIAFGAIATLCIGIISITNNINEDLDYMTMYTEREVLVAALDNSQSDQITDTGYLYEQIIEYNNKLRQTKKWADNIWVGSMYNDKIATLDYIEIPRVDVP